MLSRVLSSKSVAGRHLLPLRLPVKGHSVRAQHFGIPANLHRHNDKHFRTNSSALGTMGGPEVSGVFSMGPGTLQIDRRQFHEPCRQSVIKRMQEKLPEGERGIAVLEVCCAPLDHE